MIYVGANDAMLHGFDASTASVGGSEPGVEKLGYVPNTLFGSLQTLASPQYSHQYYVDGSPRVSDAYFGGSWHTVLVSTTAAGGKGIFALDVTNPESFATTSPVLWELNDTITASNPTADYIGYTMAQASIVKIHYGGNGPTDGKWVAIIGNGYINSKDEAALLIIDIETGKVITAISTCGTSGCQTNNGLSTPVTADINGDGIVDAVYAGDLLGNMWKFDVSNGTGTTGAGWKVAYGAKGAPLPMFVACSDKLNCNTTRQAITNKPQVGSVSATQTASTPDSVMVYFGTGKYFEKTDNLVANAQTQSFYGVWDQCPLDNGDGIYKCPKSGSTTPTTIPKTALLQQTIVSEQLEPSGDNVRITSNTEITYPDKKGWYMDFVSTDPAVGNQGERIVSASLLRNGRIIFVTLIPTRTTSDLCSPEKTGSTSWLMELDALSGKRLASPAFDINQSGSVTTGDVTAGAVTGVVASGIKMTNGSTKTPAVITNGTSEMKFMSSSTGDTVNKPLAESGTDSSSGESSRQSWRQLIDNQ
jgi:type IV pilus assembly protein PilY1